MGLLTEGPAPRRAKGGPGEKFIRLFRDMDADDRAMIRRWVDEGRGYTYVHAKVAEHFDIGYTTVERGLWRLEASQWEC